MSKLQNFYTRSAIFVILSLFGAGINYLLYPLLTRVINIREFGDYITIIGISNQVIGILLAFSIISIAFVKQYGEVEARNKTELVQKWVLWLFIGISILILICSSLLQRLLQIEDNSSFLVLAIILLLAVPGNIWTGFLQGHKEHIRVGVYGASMAVLKLVLVLLFASSFGVLGGLGGFLLGSLIGLIVLYNLPGRKPPGIRALFVRPTEADKSFARENMKYILQTIFVVAGIVFLQNYDLNRAKALFDPNTAGIYSGVSILSNALYYVIFLLIWILLPEFSVNDRAANKRVLATAYRLIAITAIAVVVVGLVFGDRLLTLLLGHNFDHQGRIFVAASLYQISLVATALYAFYLLILRKRRSTLLTGSILLSCVLIPLSHSQTPYRMIVSLWLSVVAGIGVYLVIMRVKNSLYKPSS